MKEASGELNMTAITVVAIAAVATFFMVFVWPNLQKNITNSQKCASAVCEACSNGAQICHYTDDNNSVTDITCPCKN